MGTVWGILFIATHGNRPEEKVRNFKKTLKKGKTAIREKMSSCTGGVASDAEGGGEEQPNWDIAHGGPPAAANKSNGGRESENERSV